MHVDQWKNIPKPVCEATANVFEGIETLKRFSQYLDSRLSSIVSASTESSQECFDLVKSNRREILELVDRVEWSTKERQRELFEKTEE